MGGRYCSALMTDLVIQSLRGDAVESSHRVHAVVIDAGGRRVAASGDPAFPTFLRSAAKPFQALPLVEDGVVPAFGIAHDELALACASHNSEKRQVEIVRGLLERIGCSERDLACGPHRPLSLDLAVRGPDDPRATDEVPRTPIASNCSGKHSGMLALAKHHGWPTAGYERADHPVQRRCREEMARWSGVRPETIVTGVDGCGVVCFQVPLEKMALAYARFGASGDTAPRAIVAAMQAHPELVGGVGRLDTMAMQTYGAELLVKVGAEGVYGAALPRRGLGIALKVEDGHGRAAMAALVAILGQLGLEPAPREALDRFAEFGIENTRGRIVGSLRPTGALALV